VSGAGQITGGGGFTPATSIKEAEAFTKKLGIEVKYDFNIDGKEKLLRLNEFNEVIDDIYLKLPKTNGKIGRVTIWERESARADALLVDKSGNIINYDIKIAGKGKFSKISREDGVFMTGQRGFDWGLYNSDLNFNSEKIAKKFTSGSSVKTRQEMITHEVGHAVLDPKHSDWSLARKKFDKWVDNTDGIFSAYGSKNYDEALAEAFVELHRGTYKAGMLPEYFENKVTKAFNLLK